MQTIAMQVPPEPALRPGQLRGWLEILAIIALIEVGGILGALTGFAPLAAIAAALVPLAAASWFLAREGTSWRRLAFGRRLGVAQVAGYALLAFVLCVVLVLPVQMGLKALGLPEPDFSAFSRLLEGNLTMYLWMLIPVSWGSAAIGEELLARGFLQHRFTGLVGRGAAVVLQAFIFAIAHFYQGLTGVLQVFVIALVFGSVYLRTRNLLPSIIAHGAIDSVSMTILYLGEAELLQF